MFDKVLEAVAPVGKDDINSQEGESNPFQTAGTNVAVLDLLTNGTYRTFFMSEFFEAFYLLIIFIIEVITKNGQLGIDNNGIVWVTCLNVEIGCFQMKTLGQVAYLEMGRGH